MIKNETFNVYDRMDRKMLETMALAFEADAAAASTQGLEFIKARLGIVYALLKYKIHKDWLPTPENINALPEPVRKFIHDLETNVDPAHLVRENILIKDTCKVLVLKLEERPGAKDEFVNKLIDEIWKKYRVSVGVENLIKKTLKEAGVKVVKK